MTLHVLPIPTTDDKLVQLALVSIRCLARAFQPGMADRLAAGLRAQPNDAGTLDLDEASSLLDHVARVLSEPAEPKANGAAQAIALPAWLLGSPTVEPKAAAPKAAAPKAALPSHSDLKRLGARPAAALSAAARARIVLSSEGVTWTQQQALSALIGRGFSYSTGRAAWQAFKKQGRAS